MRFRPLGSTGLLHGLLQFDLAQEVMGGHGDLGEARLRRLSTRHDGQSLDSREVITLRDAIDLLIYCDRREMQ